MSSNGKANDNGKQPLTTLSGEQLRALDGLAAGLSVADAAKHAGVHRVTIWKWLKNDAEFIAERNRHEIEARLAIRAEVRSLAADAVKLVKRCVTADGIPMAVRLRAALGVLQAAGALDPPDIGPPDAEAVREETEEVEAARAVLRRQRRHALRDVERAALIAGDADEG